MSAFSFDTQRAVLTIAAFVGTFIVALSIGRFLKRRANVRLGTLYQFFCLALAFYVALAVYGVQASWRVHFGAAALLLSTALIVALVNRYVWDLYFERRKQTTIPHFLREIVKTTIVNLHYPTEVHAMRIRIGIDYSVPPNRVKDALMRAAQSAVNVLPEPKVRVFLVDFADHAVLYEIKFYMGNHSRINETNDAIRTNVWYELKREQIRIPFPIRTLHLERHAPRPVEEGHEEARAILRGEPLFQCLSDGQIDNLVKQSELNHFGRGERVIEEGAEGDSMFILLRGAAEVSISKNGSTIPV